MNELAVREEYKKVRFIAGKDTRHRSIAEGVKDFDGRWKPDVLIVHDAVRPFVEVEVLENVVDAAAKYGAAGAVRPLVSTVLKVTADGFLDQSLVRSEHRASEMPQAFRFDLINQAYKKCSDHDFLFGTECLHLVLEYCGVRAKLVEGTDSLWKVTYKSDLERMEKVLRDRKIR